MVNSFFFGFATQMLRPAANDAATVDAKPAAKPHAAWKLLLKSRHKLRSSPHALPYPQAHHPLFPSPIPTLLLISY